MENYTYCKLFTVCVQLADDLEMSESESDHSEDSDDSESNNTVNTEEQIPGELEEIDKEKQEKMQFIRWFSLLLLRIKLHYKLSNNLFTILLTIHTMQYVTLQECM